MENFGTKMKEALLGKPAPPLLDSVEEFNKVKKPGQRYYRVSRWEKWKWWAFAALPIIGFMINPKNTLAVVIVLLCLGLLVFLFLLALKIIASILEWLLGTGTLDPEQDNYHNAKKIVAIVHANGMNVPAPYSKTMYHTALDVIARDEREHPDWVEPDRDYLSPEERRYYIQKCRANGWKYEEV